MASKFHISRARRDRYWELRLLGCFDGTSAWELRRAMGKLRRSALTLDFSGVSELHDFGLAVLAAHFVSRKGPPVEFVGLDALGQAALRGHGLDTERLAGRLVKPHPVLGYLEPVP